MRIPLKVVPSRHKPTPLADDITLINLETMEADCTYNGCIDKFKLRITPTERLDSLSNYTLKQIKKGHKSVDSHDEIFVFIEFDQCTMACEECGRTVDTDYSKKLTGKSYNINRAKPQDQKKVVTLDYFELDKV